MSRKITNFWLKIVSKIATKGKDKRKVVKCLIVFLYQVWDGVSNRCINTFKSAHGGEPVSVL